MSGDVEKEEVECLLGCRITEEQFEAALEYARRKQGILFRKDGNPIMLQHGYLVRLAEESARSLILSGFTVGLCMEIRHMEKERLTKSQNAQLVDHIVSVPAS